MNAKGSYIRKAEPEGSNNHPNLELEEDIESLEYIIGISNNSDDYVNLNYLSYFLRRKKFTKYEMDILQDLKHRYLIRDKKQIRFEMVF